MIKSEEKLTKTVKLATTSTFKKRPACQKSKKKSTTAFIRCDIGWGNTLFVRGEGASLNWNKGIALTYDKTQNSWIFKTNLDKPLEFKVLINDVLWCEGENLKLNPGDSQVFEPRFI